MLSERRQLFASHSQIQLKLPNGHGWAILEKTTNAFIETLYKGMKLCAKNKGVTSFTDGF
jgi:hypothetical protein